MNLHFIFFTIVIKKRVYTDAELKEIERQQKLSEELEATRTKYLMYTR
ncbi:YrzI family small protein [Alkalicoccobacillus gibsonii]|nr:YrzI family small protein [Alkalicoccobacillus gibsonii]MBM0064137.1 YrzI family small protein [Alkalicoccobacillus gibsonii]